MDIARWMIPEVQFGQRAFSALVVDSVIKDQAETANTQLAIFDYGESLLVFDVRGLSGKSNMGVSNHVYFDKNAQNRKIPPAMESKVLRILWQTGVK